MEAAHDLPTAGHLGSKKTEALIRAQCSWHGLSRDGRNWCKTCITCFGRRLPPAVAQHL